MLSFNDVSIVIRTVSTHRQEMLERLQNQLTPLNFVISDRSDRLNTYADDWFNAMRKGQGGGNHGGGRPKIPLELKKVTVAFSLNPITLATLRAVASLRKISVSDLANQILEDHFTE